jgi:hypothetical protein
MLKTTAVIFSLILCCIISVSANAEPAKSYVIHVGADTCKFVLEAAAEEKYFIDMIGKIYRFVVDGQPLKDSAEARHEIMRVLKNSYMNQLAKIEVDKAVRLKKRGFCVPSILTSTGKEGPAFAIAFLVEKGLLKAFVVGSSLNCSAMSIL